MQVDRAVGRRARSCVYSGVIQPQLHRGNDQGCQRLHGYRRRRSIAARGIGERGVRVDSLGAVKRAKHQVRQDVNVDMSAMLAIGAHAVQSGPRRKGARSNCRHDSDKVGRRQSRGVEM